MTPWQHLVLAACLVLSPGFPSQCGPPATLKKESEHSKPARTDRYGDPLPPGAIARLGTLRFRRTDAERLRWVEFLPGDKEIFAAYEHSASFWDATTGREKRRLGHEGAWLALSSDGKCAACGAKGLVRVMDLVTGKTVRSFKAEVDEVPSAAFSPDDRMLAVGEEKQVALWELSSGKLRTRLRGPHKGRVVSLSFSADGRRLASACHRCEGCVWDLPSGKPWRKFGADSVILSPDGKRLVASGGFSWLRSLDFLDLEADKPLPAPEAKIGGFVSGSFSPDGHLLYVTMDRFHSGSTLVWDLHRKKSRLEFAGPVVGLSRNGQTLALQTDEHGFRLIEATTGKDPRPSPGCGENAFYCVVFSPDGSTVLTAVDSGVFRRWCAATGEELRHLPVGDMTPERVSFSPDQKVMGIIDRNNFLALWDVASGKRLCQWGRNPEEERLTFHADPRWSSGGDGFLSAEGALAVRFASDKQSLALAVSDGTVRFWDPVKGKELGRVRPQTREKTILHPKTPAIFSPDGNRLAQLLYVGYKEAVVIWEVSTGKVIHQHNLTNGGSVPIRDTHKLFISRDEQMLVVAREDTASFRDLATGSELWQTPCLTWYRPVELSPDGRWLACSGNENSVLLYEMATGKEAACWKGHEGDIKGISFSPDGRRLATLSGDGTGLIWNLTHIPVPATATTNEVLWQSLAASNATRARQALLTLATRPEEAVALAGKRLRPAPRSALPGRIMALVTRLDSKELAERNKAGAELAGLGPEASPVLRSVLAGRPSAEVRRRVEPVWQKLARSPSAEQLLAMRAVALLEMVGTPAAQRVLEDLAAGAAEARLTQEAKAALQQLARRLGTGRGSNNSK
jgi:WD40 repeat protein